MSARMEPSSRQGTRRTRSLLLGVVLALVMIGTPSILAQTVPPTTQTPSTEPPPSTAVPTVPVTEVPPTQVPPTETPTEPATEVPTVVPSEEPTEQPTEEPTETPASTPQPFPTDPPAPPPPPQQDATRDAGDIDVECTSLDTLATPTVDTGDWTLRSCTLPFPTDGLESIEIVGKPVAPGWRVLVLEPGAPNTPGLLDASNNRATLTSLEEVPRATFLIGTQRTCSGIPQNMLTLDILTLRDKGTSPTTYTAELPLQETAEPAPVVALDQATVTDGMVSVAVSWEQGSARCGWSLQVWLDGADGLQLASVTAPTGTLTAAHDGVLTFLIPAGSTSGSAQAELTFTGNAPTSVLVEGVARP